MAANGNSMLLACIGSVTTPSVALSDVYYLLSLTMNLATVGKIYDSGCDVNFSVSEYHFRDIHDAASSSVDLYSFWLNRVRGKLDTHDISSCSGCKLAKFLVLPFSNIVSFSNALFDLVQTNVWGPSPNLYHVDGGEFMWFPYCKCSSAGRILGAYNLGVATPRALVHADDKTSRDARSWYVISGDAKLWVVIVLHIFTVILHNWTLFEVLAQRLGFLQTYELTNIIVDIFEYHFQVKRMIVKVKMCDSRL
ncbi:hypothetical protein Tco_1210404 [Tanacetum coccineum]